MSIASIIDERIFSVKWYFAIADTTEGFSPKSIAPVDKVVTASIKYALPPIRARASSMPSILPIGILN